MVAWWYLLAVGFGGLIVGWFFARMMPRMTGTLASQTEEAPRSEQATAT